jgi:hypothetical protein
LVLFGRNFDDWGVFIGFVKVLDTDDLRYLTFSINGEADRSQALELNLQKAFNHVVLPDWRYFDRYFYLSSFFLPDFKPNLLKVLESFIASD